MENIMRHVSLMCENHPKLRWSCKEIAVSGGRFDGSRQVFFRGQITDPVKLYSDGSGVECDEVIDGKRIQECECPGSALVIAPEDKLIKQ